MDGKDRLAVTGLVLGVCGAVLMLSTLPKLAVLCCGLLLVGAGTFFLWIGTKP